MKVERLKAIKDEAIESQKVIDQSDITKEQRFSDLISGLTLKIDLKKYPTSIFLFKDSKCYVEYDIKYRYLWLNYTSIWKVFEDEYKLNYDQIQLFVKETVEEYFKFKGITPTLREQIYGVKVEEHFKCKGLTPG